MVYDDNLDYCMIILMVYDYDLDYCMIVMIAGASQIQLQLLV